VTRASFFGVGAPEALLVGVVALVVFGPKGLAEVSANGHILLSLAAESCLEMQTCLMTHSCKSYIGSQVAAIPCTVPMRCLGDDSLRLAHMS
jgi:mttA/Hcf106 family